MKDLNVVSKDEWLQARKEFLKKEKAFTYAREKLNEERRQLPMVKVETSYFFESNQGKISLLDLFDNHNQLIIYHFMYGKDWEQGCPSCSFWADNFNGIEKHLAARNTAFAVTSNASLAVLNNYKKRLKWDFNWLSTGESNFSQDYGVTFIENDKTINGYNYSDWLPEGEMPGISVFYRDGNEIFHSYSTYGRGLDMLNGTYHYLDLTPKGRDEGDLEFTQAWVKRRDEY